MAKPNRIFGTWQNYLVKCQAVAQQMLHALFYQISEVLLFKSNFTNQQTSPSYLTLLKEINILLRICLPSKVLRSMTPMVDRKCPSKRKRKQKNEIDKAYPLFTYVKGLNKSK